MNKQDISIATISWARDEHEEQLLRKSLQKLSELKLPVFITDGGSSESFISFIESFPNFKLLTTKEKGVWAQAKNSLIEAAKTQTKFILYTEPDKLDFFHSLPGMIEETVVDEQSGIIMASRSEAGFATFAAFQQMTETTINNCCAEIIGDAVDYTYGPFLLNAALVADVVKMKDDTGWGWRPYAFTVAKRLGYKVEAFISDFECPVDQRQDTNTERIYRMKQLKQNIEGILLGNSVVLKTI